MLNENIKKIGKQKSFTKHEHLFHQKELAQYFYYIIKGRVRVYRLGAEAKELEVNLIEAGGFLGEIILFTTDKYPANAQAMEDTEVLYFNKKVFLEALRADHTIAEFMLELLAKKCIMLNKRLESLNIKTPRQRLIEKLLHKCPGDHSCLIELDMKKVELARHIGITPEALSRNLKQLQEEKLIKLEGKKIRLLDCINLKKLL